MAAVLVVPALDLSGTMPLTPGNVGFTSGAVAMAMRAHCVGLTTALTTGIAFHAVETVAGIAFGLASVVFLAPFSSTGASRRTMLTVGAATCAVLIGAFGATVLVDPCSQPDDPGQGSFAGFRGHEDLFAGAFSLEPDGKRASTTPVGRRDPGLTGPAGRQPISRDVQVARSS